jgi:hypothetical protein
VGGKTSIRFSRGPKIVGAGYRIRYDIQVERPESRRRKDNMGSRRNRPVRVIEDTNRYLLQLSPGLYYLRAAGDLKPLGVRAPSVAAHLSYEEADRLCQHFRSMGYQGPVVVDIYGRVIDGDALEAERRTLAERSAKFWGE